MMNVVISAKIAGNVYPRITDIYIIKKDGTVWTLDALETRWDTENGIFRAEMEDVSVELCICDESYDENKFENNKKINIWGDVEDIIIGVEDFYEIDIIDIENIFSDVKMQITSGPLNLVFNDDDIIVENQIVLDVVADDLYNQWLQDIDDEFEFD